MTRPGQTDSDSRERRGESAGSSTRTDDHEQSGSKLDDLMRQLGPLWLGSSGGGAEPLLSPPERFEVLRRLGSGGFGDVWLVHDRAFQGPRALKIPRHEATTPSPSRTRLLNEARAAGALDHPNVIRIFDVQESGPACFLVMEYCEAGSLASWLASRPNGPPLPLRWVAEFVARLADGVEHVHSRGFLHRDLKPSNVLLVVERAATEGEPPRFLPKVADFGLVKNIHDPDGLAETPSDALVGTLAYMAPEQARRNPSGITASTDIYGLGTILYELLAGHRPFAGLHHTDLIIQILRHDPRPPRVGLPRDLEAIVNKSLAKQPGDRYPTAAALAADLRRWLEGVPILARPTPAWKRVRAWARRHPAPLGAAALVALSLLGGSFWIEAKRNQEAATWLERLSAANLPGLPELFESRTPDDHRLAAGAARIFESAQGDRKLAAAAFLAPARPDCASTALDGLLKARPEVVVPLVRSLADRVPGMVPKLAATLASTALPDASLEEREELDRRRARAATALILLGDNRGWDLLKFATDPQARSFLVHDLGPSGVEPANIVERLHAETDPTARRTLIQSLGEIPERAWPASLLDSTVADLLKVYREESDPGIHGSSKWLLKSWDRTATLKGIDQELMDRPKRDTAEGWRVSKTGLTFVTLPKPVDGRRIEVLDTEVTREVFSRFLRDHRHDRKFSSEPDAPANNMTYYLAAEFCEAWNAQENHPASYGRIIDANERPGFAPLPGYLDRSGYRLLTLEELTVACKAGTSTRRYFGESSSLLASYAWGNQPGRISMSPVARLKPNDYGLFDTLGNAVEIGQSLKLNSGPWNQAVLYGGTINHNSSSIGWDCLIDGFNVNQPLGIGTFGFRVARTLSVVDPPTASRLPGGP